MRVDTPYTRLGAIGFLHSKYGIDNYTAQILIDKAHSHGNTLHRDTSTPTLRIERVTDRPGLKGLYFYVLEVGYTSGNDKDPSPKEGIMAKRAARVVDEAEELEPDEVEEEEAEPDEDAEEPDEDEDEAPEEARAVAEDDEDEEAAKDYTVYADKEPTPTMSDFADWLEEEVGLEFETEQEAAIFRMGVRLGGTLRMEFQRSDFNRERRAERKSAKAAKPKAAETAKAAKKPAKAAKASADAEPAAEAAKPAQAKPATRGRRTGATAGRPAARTADRPAAAKRGGRKAATAEAPY